MRNAFRAILFGFAISAGASTAVSDDQPAVEDRKALEVGQPFPELTCTDRDGRPWRAADHIGRTILVIYFSAGDFTDGGVEQANGFREELTRLKQLNVEVVGISGDAVATHDLFKKSHGLRYTLLADADGTVAETLGIPVTRSTQPTKIRTRGLDCQPIMDDRGRSIIVARQVTHARWTLIVDVNGKLISKRSEVNPAGDADEVRKVIESLLPAPIP